MGYNLNMFEYLEKLRQKPESSRKKIAFFTSFSVVAVIFAVWLTVIYPDFKKETDQKIAESKTDESTENFARTFTEGVGRIGSEIGKVKSLISVFSSATTTYYSATDMPKNE